MVQPKEVVSLTEFYDAWSRCVSSRYQRDQYYRNGKFDSCSQQWKDLKVSMRAKLCSEEADAKALLATTSIRQATDVSPTVGVIWELKDPPSWD